MYAGQKDVLQVYCLASYWQWWVLRLHCETAVYKLSHTSQYAWGNWGPYSAVELAP